jgi:hypothetical protein
MVRDCKTALYRLFDSGGRLLYVGTSAQPEVRYSQHAAEKPWWPDVASKGVEWFDDRALAVYAEESAIDTEQPLYNKRGLPGWPRPDPLALGSNCMTVAAAKADPDAMIAMAERERGPAYLTRRGKRLVAVVNAELAEAIAEVGGPDAFLAATKDARRRGD